MLSFHYHIGNIKLRLQV